MPTSPLKARNDPPRLLRGVGVGLAVLAVFAIQAGMGPATARAANATVTTGSPTNKFSPNVVNINAGDKVTFTWAAGTHVVDLKDVSPDLPIDSADTSGTTNAFTAPGTYYYYCSIHATEEQATEAHVQANDAMVGKIVVAAASASPTSTSTAAASPAQQPGAPATGSGAMSISSGPTTVLEILGVALLGAAITTAFASRRLN